MGEFLTSSAIVVIGGPAKKLLEGQCIAGCTALWRGGSSSANLLPVQKNSIKKKKDEGRFFVNAGRSENSESCTEDESI